MLLQCCYNGNDREFPPRCREPPPDSASASGASTTPDYSIIHHAIMYYDVMYYNIALYTVR